MLLADPISLALAFFAGGVVAFTIFSRGRVPIHNDYRNVHSKYLMAEMIKRRTVSLSARDAEKDIEDQIQRRATLNVSDQRQKEHKTSDSCKFCGADCSQCGDHS